MAESHTYFINRKRGKEVRAGTEKYVLSESEMGLIVNE